MGFLATRVAVLKAGLDQWQSEQINRKLYYLSILSMIFLPLNLITGCKPPCLMRIGVNVHDGG